MDGDWAKGPAGTNEVGWQMGNEMFPWANEGRLAERVEYSGNGHVTLHIRQGIHFHDLPPVNGRELDAYDVAYSFNRILFQEGSKSYFVQAYKDEDKLQSAKALDQWTVQLTWNTDGAMQKMWRYLHSNMSIIPREVVDQYGDYRDWSTHVGTGPFILTDYVEGSAYTFQRNPNYWRDDPLNPGNQLPYVDKVTVPEIAEWSTELAALRTGKIDWSRRVEWEDFASLMKSSPWLQSQPEPGYGLAIWPLTYDKVGGNPIKPFSDIRVRRALWLAIDNEAIRDDFYGGFAELVGWPTSDFFPALRSYHTPLEEQPVATQELYGYNPNKAKQLLAEAGYPDGFSTSVTAQEDMSDLLSLVAAYWSKVGITLDIDIREKAVYSSIRQAAPPKSYEMFANWQHEGAITALHYWNPDDPINFTQTYIPEAVQALEDIKDLPGQFNLQAMLKLLKPFFVFSGEQAYGVTLPIPLAYRVWAPWVQNYRGEYSVGTSSYYTWVMYSWMDPEIKKALGGR